MALKSTIFKAEINIADMDRHHYQTHSITIARHPSENDERMMVRVVAFGLHADEALAFGKGLSSNEEAALWRKDLTGAVEQWIEVGLPDARVLKKAASRAKELIVYAYGGRSVGLWWAQQRDELTRLSNLRVIELPAEATEALGRIAERNMTLQCTVQESQVWLGDARNTVHFEPIVLFDSQRDSRR